MFRKREANCMNFREQHSFEKRKEESLRMRTKYPDRTPVIIEKSPNETYLSSLEKTKFLVPCDLTIGQLLYVIRRRLKLAPEKALFFLVEGTMPASTAIVSSVYNNSKNLDGFLYITYNSESTFGSH
tara:strand:+ start:645 stop:1025 length:381 start_codon:yes stop_codon:yes gene_type:complete